MSYQMDNMGSQTALGDTEESTQDRDPQGNNDFVKVGFSDVIGEPPTARSPQFSYNFTKAIFDNTTLVTYSLFTLIFGWMLSLLYGLIYGMTSFIFIWIFTPFSRVWCIPLGFMEKAWISIVKAVFDPLTRSYGLIFSRVDIKFRKTKAQNV